MQVSKRSVGYRAGRALGGLYSRIASVEDQHLQSLPRTLGVGIKLTVRLAIIAVLAFYILVPLLIAAALAGIAVVLWRNAGETATPATHEFGKYEWGADGYGVYKDGIRVI